MTTPSAASPSTAATETASPTSEASGQTFRGNGVSFQYPGSWQELTLSGTTASTGSQLWNETVGTDGVNLVSVSAHTLNIAITSDNIAEQKDAISQQVTAVFTQAGGGIDSGPTDETMAGLPALRFTGTANNPDGQPVNSTLVLAFDGTTEYLVNCQYDSTGQSEILAGCDQVVSTFALG